MDAISDRLLAFGFLPKELPPCFRSQSFQRWASTTKNPPGAPKASQSAIHSLRRSGGVRRALTIPNPANYLKLARMLEQDWPEIEQCLGRSTASISTPARDPSNVRAFQPRVRLADRFLERVKHRRRGAVLLLADIAECYRSLYTHAIPWALHEKSTAKKSRGRALIGNRLDDAVRNAQDGQTNGIPVGPDSSLIVAEIILSAIDKIFLGKTSPVGGFRFYDDYEFTYSTHGEAEEAQGELQKVLSEYNLGLNPSKSKIVHLPDLIEAPWLVPLRDFDFRGGRRGSAHRLVQYFETAFENSRRFNDSFVVSYALGRLDRRHWTADEWAVLQNLLLQALTSEPSAAQQFVAALVAAKLKQNVLDKDAIGSVLNDLVAAHAPRGNGSEAVWGLYGILLFQMPVERRAAVACRASTDPFVLVLAHDAHQRGLAPDFQPDWLATASATGFYGPYWPAIYEAWHRKWLMDRSFIRMVHDEQFPSALGKAGVTFYEPPTEPTPAILSGLEAQKEDSYGDDAEAEADGDEDAGDEEYDE